MSSPARMPRCQFNGSMRRGKGGGWSGGGRWGGGGGVAGGEAGWGGSRCGFETRGGYGSGWRKSDAADIAGGGELCDRRRDCECDADSVWRVPGDGHGVACLLRGCDETFVSRVTSAV